jgi:hypothetical protein
MTQKGRLFAAPGRPGEAVLFAADRTTLSTWGFLNRFKLTLNFELPETLDDRQPLG